MIVFIILILCIICPGCGMKTESSGINDSNKLQTVSLATWNTQTFFDGVTDGCEFPDFQKSKNWDKDKYKVRLERLCAVIENLNADIFVFQEIENKAILQDISNMMAGNSWNINKQWLYGCFMKEPDAPFGCCVLSKYPITNLKSHNIDIRTEAYPQPPLRAVMEVSVNVKNKNITLFVSHWKSKRGGAEATDIWRKWQETILCGCINNLLLRGEKYCIAAGDFNCDIKEFDCFYDSSSNTNIMFHSILPEYDSVSAFSPWFLENSTEKFATETGSYFYKDKWERIDNIFAVGNVKISDFSPQQGEMWTDKRGIPLRYKYYTEEGYSDHLPLKCTITF